MDRIKQYEKPAKPKKGSTAKKIQGVQGTSYQTGGRTKRREDYLSYRAATEGPYGINYSDVMYGPSDIESQTNMRIAVDGGNSTQSFRNVSENRNIGASSLSPGFDVRMETDAFNNDSNQKFFIRNNATGAIHSSMVPKYQAGGKTEPSLWSQFEGSDVGKFIDAKGLRKEKDYFLGLLGYGDTAEEGRRFALDAAATVNPISDFINAVDHAQQGKYSDAGLYAGAAILPGAAGPVVNKLKSFFKSSKIPKNFKSEIDWGKWNKKIPDNKPLMKEYDAIEASTKADGTWMKNPDGSKFTGTPEQFVQQQSKNFKAAFGESKLLNPDGSPTIQYHGTAKEFDTFDPDKFQLGDSGYSGLGIYTTPNKTTAESYALSSAKFHTGEIKPTVMELYGLGKNPVRGHELPEGTSLFTFHRPKTFAGNVPIEEQLLNHDVAIRTQRGGTRIASDHKSYENVFPTNTQLKSAVGNDGMFDMTNPNIYKKYGGKIPEYQAGGRFQIPAELMQQHRNEVKLVESADGTLMKNPQSSATGFYGQLFSEVKDLPEMRGTSRNQFAADTALQNQIYNRRFEEGLPGIPSTSRNLEDLYEQYGPQIQEKEYGPMDVAGMVNLLGRQGTREYLGYHVRDKKPLSDVFPSKYGTGKRQANKTPDEYIEEMRSIRPGYIRYNYDTDRYRTTVPGAGGDF